MKAKFFKIGWGMFAIVIGFNTVLYTYYSATGPSDIFAMFFYPGLAVAGCGEMLLSAVGAEPKFFLSRFGIWFAAGIVVLGNTFFWLLVVAIVKWLILRLRHQP
jgi:hypothetical protein